MATITKDDIRGRYPGHRTRDRSGFHRHWHALPGLPASRNETVEEACLVHNQPVEELVEKLNAIIVANRK